MDKTLKKFRRFNLTPISYLQSDKGFPIPNMVAIEIKPADSEYYLYTCIPVTIWESETELMEFVNAVVQEAGI